jgi:hypothetical protein
MTGWMRGIERPEPSLAGRTRCALNSRNWDPKGSCRFVSGEAIWWRIRTKVGGDLIDGARGYHDIAERLRATVIARFVRAGGSGGME